MDQATLFFCKIGIKNKKRRNEITIRKPVRITGSPVNRQPSTNSTANSAEIFAQFSVTNE